jgi:hypothetical protein
LTPLTLPVFAVGVHQWETWKQMDIEELPSSDGADLELEI